MKRNLNFVVISVLLFVIALSMPASAGTFNDRDGASHQWSVGTSHQLVWDGSAYIPFGYVFEPKYLSAGQTDENLAEDKAELDGLKSAGVSDLIIRMDKGLTSAPAEAFQKVVDLLESDGFAYGIDVSDPPYAPLSGYVIDPSTNRLDGVDSNGDYNKQLAGAESAVYVLCDAQTSEIRQCEETAVVNGQASVKVAIRSSRPGVFLFYPMKTIKPGDHDWGLPDLWRGFDDTRDKLIAYFSAVKFGKGLRFFINPFNSDFKIIGESNMVVPSSPEFRLQYSAWLSKKYHTPEDLLFAWGMKQHSIESFDVAARLIPLWNNGRGVASVYDSVEHRKYDVDIARTRLWSDFLAFREHSIKGYMDSIAGLLKRTVADVPVVFTSTQLHSIFQASGDAGYDGLAVAPADGAQTVTENTGRAYSIVDNSAKGLWLFSDLKRGDAGFATKESLYSDINAARSLGSKGFFVDMTPTSDITGWLSGYASIIKLDKSFVGYKPSTMYYPPESKNTSIKRFGSDLWWLPGLAAGKNMPLGDYLAGYTIGNMATGAPDLYVWSLRGKQTIHLASTGKVTLVSLSGGETTISPKKGIVTLPLSMEPTLVRGISPEMFVPEELVLEMMADLQKAVADAENRLPDAAGYKLAYEQARDIMAKGQFGTALDMARTALADLQLRLKGLGPADK